MLRFVDMGLKPPTVHWKVCFPFIMGKVELGDGNRLSIVMNMLLALPGLKRNRQQGGQSFPLVDLQLDRGLRANRVTTPRGRKERENTTTANRVTTRRGRKERENTTTANRVTTRRGRKERENTTTANRVTTTRGRKERENTTIANSQPVCGQAN